MMFETHTNSIWTFSAQSAQGYSTIYCDLTQQDLNKLTIDSNIAEGEMFLILIQDKYSKSIDLSGGAKNLSAEEMDLDMFNPGRISMRLKFNNAKDLSVNINWR
ncbi:hypothetical protein [Candidatus Bathycorpusculum sp.]|uniref:hypothetical protein n=1 Tax=Candidatus Bathycorpusculum sp. TaxID=2994959 RepID=UPI00282D835F|nr:hypothetical protein [Candidatus Termitimicrobium sp.]